MKISIEGLIGSANKIKGQTHTEEESRGGKRNGAIKADSVEIENRVNTRLDNIQKELKEIQSSLTRNQIIKDGLNRLIEDQGRGGKNTAAILDESRFEGKKILHEFVGDGASKAVLETRQERVDALISTDINKLTKLNIELENIMASSIRTAEKLDDMVKNIETSLNKTVDKHLHNISRLNADTVMRLIR